MEEGGGEVSFGGEAGKEGTEKVVGVEKGGTGWETSDKHSFYLVKEEKRPLGRGERKTNNQGREGYRIQTR